MNWRYQQFWYGGVGTGVLSGPFLAIGLIAALTQWPKQVGTGFPIFLSLLFIFPEWASNRVPRITVARVLIAVICVGLNLHFVGGVI